MDTLERKVDDLTQDNSDLKRRLDTLQNSNNQLLQELKQLKNKVMQDEKNRSRSTVYATTL